MRFSEFHPVDEAAMNPAAFAQAIEQGQSRGVLVGFEFEVCIPHATFAEKTDSRTPDAVLNIIRSHSVLNNLNFHQVTPQAWDQVFHLRQPVNGIANMEQAYENYQAGFFNRLQELYNQIPEKELVKYRDNILKIAKDRLKRRGLKKTDPGYNQTLQIEFAEDLGRVVYSNNSNNAAERAGEKLMSASRQQWRGLLEYALGQSIGKIEKDFNQLFDYDTDQAYDLLQLEDWEDDYYDEDSDYEEAAAFLKPQVEQTMGAPVHIFQRYHQSRKNLTDWYIEPDGSLSANDDGDATAEIVSPPLPAAQAVDALKRFYVMAGQLNLYTNNSTGLHINVSIPDKLDVLKLAVFTGDQYVLQQFGRQDSDYAVSSQQAIANRTARSSNIIDVKTKQKPGVLGQPKTKNTINVKALQQIAQYATDDHTASISNNGKYISFRHAGGNYLQDYTSIFNVVGRFIRAMIIASDPTAYAQEYQTKLAKLAGTSPTAASQTTSALVNYVRTNGLPVIKVDVMRFNNTRKALNLARDAMQGRIPDENLNDRNVLAVPGGESARQAIASKMQNPNRKEKVESAPVQNFFSMTIVPDDVNSMKKFLTMNLSAGVDRIDQFNGYTDTGYAVYSKAVLPITDPVSKTFLKTMLTTHYGKKTNPR